MKKNDIVLVVVIGFFSVIISLVVSNVLFSGPEQKQQEAYVIDTITDDFSTTDERYFNSDSINPTQLIRIGETTNQDPFSGQ